MKHNHWIYVYKIEVRVESMSKLYVLPMVYTKYASYFCILDHSSLFKKEIHSSCLLKKYIANLNKPNVLLYIFFWKKVI